MGPWSQKAANCPPGMVFISGGDYATGMVPPLPYGVVDTTLMDVVDALHASPKPTILVFQQKFPEEIAGSAGESID